MNLERALSFVAVSAATLSRGTSILQAVLAFEPVGADHLEIAIPAEFARYITRVQGLDAIDGISLTVAEVKEASFVVWIIPHTLEMTNLQSKKAGGLVNLEFDLLAVTSSASWRVANFPTAGSGFSAKRDANSPVWRGLTNLAMGSHENIYPPKPRLYPGRDDARRRADQHAVRDRRPQFPAGPQAGAGHAHPR